MTDIDTLKRSNRIRVQELSALLSYTSTRSLCAQDDCVQFSLADGSSLGP